MSNLLTNYCLQPDFQKTDQHTGLRQEINPRYQKPQANQLQNPGTALFIILVEKTTKT